MIAFFGVDMAMLVCCGESGLHVCSGGGMTGIYEKKQQRLESHYCMSYNSVGVTGFEPATTRPPDAYSNRAELHPELRMQKYGFFPR